MNARKHNKGIKNGNVCCDKRGKMCDSIFYRCTGCAGLTTATTTCSRYEEDFHQQFGIHSGTLKFSFADKRMMTLIRWHGARTQTDGSSALSKGIKKNTYFSTVEYLMKMLMVSASEPTKGTSSTYKVDPMVKYRISFFNAAQLLWSIDN